MIPEASKQPEHSARRVRRLAAPLALLALAAAVWAVYGRSLAAPFFFDDTFSVVENESITRLWPLFGDAGNRGPLNPPVDTPLSARPLVSLSLALNYHFGQLDPRGYRAVNIAFHLLSALLLWVIVRRTLQAPWAGGAFADAAGPLALAVALLWAVHPLATEAVVYVTQRTELMVAFFYLATLYGCIRYWHAATRRAQVAWLIAATTACLAGAASKEVMVSAPLVVLLYERTFVRDRLRNGLRRSWPLYAGLLASWVLLVALQWNQPRSGSAGFGLDVPLAVWWFNQARFFVMYLKLAVYPWPLLVHYEVPYLGITGAGWIYVTAAATLALATLVLLLRRRAAGFLLACVFAILAPTHLVPIVTEIAAERRMYLPLAALVALAVAGGYALVRRIAAAGAGRGDPRTGRGLPVAACAVAVVVLAVVFAFASAQRVAAYGHPMTLWQETVASQPLNYRAQHGLALELAIAGRFEEAIERFRLALKVKPDHARSHYGLGRALVHVGRRAEAIGHLETAVLLEPTAYRFRNTLGVELAHLGRLPEAIAQFEKALELRPDDVGARDNLDRARQLAGLPASRQSSRNGSSYSR